MSCKHNEELKVAQANKIAHMVEIDELENGRWLKQIDTFNELEMLVGVFTWDQFLAWSECSVQHV
jgi:hypothetical protein